MGIVALAESASFTFTADMFASIGTMFASCPPIVLSVGVPIMAVSICIGFVISKIRRVAR